MRVRRREPHSILRSPNEDTSLHMSARCSLWLVRYTNLQMREALTQQKREAMKKPAKRKPQLGNVLRKWRLMRELGMREAAKEIGIGASTLCRIEGGKSADNDTLMTIMRWLFGDGR